MLAECLCEDGDYERADRYVHFCEACNTAFSPQLRNYQVRYVANVIEAVCEYHQTRYARLLKIACAGAVILLGLVAWLLLRQKRRRPQA
jgi:glucan phosphoethanolaminetransferase (alkaline phosphatase superfamily)